jgi:hypothetical protein
MCAAAPDIAQPRHLFVNDRRALRGKASDDMTAAFASPVEVDDNKYVINASAAPSVGTWAANAPDVEMVYTAHGPQRERQRGRWDLRRVRCGATTHHRITTAT